MRGGGLLGDEGKGRWWESSRRLGGDGGGGWSAERADQRSHVIGDT